jgi:hypothetical protein
VLGGEPSISSRELESDSCVEFISERTVHPPSANTIVSV